MRQTTTFNVTFTQERNVCIAEVEERVYSEYEGKPLEFVVRHTGTSKREPGEPYSAFVGQAFALARALRSMADDLEKSGWDELRGLEAQHNHLSQPSLTRESSDVTAALVKPQLESIANETKEVKKTRLNPVTAKQLQKRNTRICKMWDDGWTAQYIAEKFSLTTGRVYQIVSDARKAAA